MRRFLFYIAFLSSLLVIAIHILAVLEINIVESNFYEFLLTAFLIIISIPTILFIKKDDRQNEDVYGLKLLVVNKPKAFYSLIIGLIIYGIFNFVLFFTKTIGKGTVDIKNGMYVSHNHGKDSKKITKEEYQLYKINELRFGSGEWVCCYTIIAIALYQPKKKSSKANKS